MSDENLIPAASVLLVRDADDGLEVLMVRRSQAVRNFTGMWVFPGGRIDPEDHEGTDDILGAALNAAKRETAEEASMQINADHLFYLSRWTAPEGAPKRFDTWFFVGVIEEEQDVVVDGGEISEHRWIKPGAVIAEQAAGELKMMPPTYVSLLEIDKFSDCEELQRGMQDFPAFHFAPKVSAVGETAFSVSRRCWLRSVRCHY